MIDISVSSLRKEFEVGNKILDGLSFQVDTGERVGLLGKNGAGKPTLRALLARGPGRPGPELLPGQPQQHGQTGHPRQGRPPALFPLFLQTPSPLLAYRLPADCLFCRK